jgi:hypothetical protein
MTFTFIALISAEPKYKVMICNEGAKVLIVWQ